MKKRFFITYDLNKTGKDYENVIESIKAASDGVWYSNWKSAFLIRTDLQSAEDVYNKINPYVDTNDTIIVIEAAYNFWGLNYNIDYVKNHIFKD